MFPGDNHLKLHNDILEVIASIEHMLLNSKENIMLNENNFTYHLR